MDDDDAHSLAEVAAQSADGQQIVEVGWTVDPSLNGDTAPHIFAFHWINGVPQCYNGCGYVPVSRTTYPGEAILGTQGPLQFAIEYFSGNWWVGVGGVWMGYFPGTEWNNPSYTKLGLAQWFGEVAATGEPICTQMGSGVAGTQPGAATITNPTVINPDGTTAPVSPNVYESDPSLYVADPTTGGVGGPGACPGTRLASAPPVLTNNATPTFSFVSGDGGATFQCALDGGAFAPCSGPGSSDTPAARLPDGAHVFGVEASDPFAGFATTTDPTPSTYSFTIDATPPHTYIDSAPPTVITQRTALFAFHSTEAGSFSCGLDGVPLTACTTPAFYAGLSDGTHIFEVRATDLATNVDPDPQRVPFVVDVAPPAISLQVKRTQRFGTRWASVRASCDERCVLRYSSQLYIRVGPRTIVRRGGGTTTGLLNAGESRVLWTRVDARLRATVRGALASGRRVELVVRVVATDVGHHPTVVVSRIRLVL